MEQCPGYEPTENLFGGLDSNNQKDSFPTFCINCSCPAYFHTLSEKPEELVFPKIVMETLRDFPIKSKDLNFNCTVLAFQVRDEKSQTKNFKELTRILKEEGYEILSQQLRLLEIEEANFLKSRMVGQSENLY